MLFRYVVAFVIACLVAGFLFLAAHQREPKADKKVLLAAKPVAQQGTHNELPPEAPRKTISRPPTGASAQPSGMAAEFAAIENGRAFVLNAWAHPEQGGRLYASRVVDYCAASRMSPSAASQSQPDISVVGGEHYLAASDALRRIQARCTQFTDNELVAYGGRGLARDDSGDRLLAQLRKFNAAPGGEGRVDALKDVLASKDPMVLNELGQKLLLVRDQVSYFYFDGEKIATKTTDSSLLAAITLLPCAFGYPCGANDPALQMECLSGAGCYSSRFEKIRATLANGDDAKMQEILAAYERLSKAIRDDDLSKFTPR